MDAAAVQGNKLLHRKGDGLGGEAAVSVQAVDYYTVLMVELFYPDALQVIRIQLCQRGAYGKKRSLVATGQVDDHLFV